MGKLFLGNSKNQDNIALPLNKVILPKEKVEISLPITQEEAVDLYFPSETEELDPVFIEKIIYVDRPVEEIKYIEVPIEVIKEVEVEKIVEVIKEIIIVEEKEIIKEVPVQIIIEKKIFKVPSWSWVIIGIEAMIIILQLIK